MLAAPFLYPVVPRATISSWAQLEVLVRVGSTLDITVLLHAADAYLESNASELVADLESEQSVWKWLRLADKAGLHVCIMVLAARTAAADRAGCAELANLQGLSPQVLQQLTIACAGAVGLAVEGSKRPMVCVGCHASTAYHFGGAAGSARAIVHRPHTLSWCCDTCKRVQS